MIYTITPSPCLDRVLRVPVVAAGLHPMTIRVADVEQRPGGKGIDVSRAVKSLGGSTMALAPLGRPTGDDVNALVMEEGLDIRPIFVGGNTRTNVIVVTPDGDEYRFNTKAPALQADEKHKFYEHIFSSVAGDSLVSIGGSSPAGTSPNWCQRIIATLRDRKRCRIALDTPADVTAANLTNPEFYPDYIKPNLKEFNDFLRRARLDGYEEGLFEQGDRESEKYLTLGAEDFLEWKYTSPENPELARTWNRLLRALANYFDHFDQRVTPIVSMGPRGCLMASRNGSKTELVHSYHPARVTLVARVGAGDSFLGGFLLALDNGQTEIEALRFGVAAATVRVSMTVEQERVQYIDREIVEEKLRRRLVELDRYEAHSGDHAPLFTETASPARVPPTTAKEVGARMDGAVDPVSAS